MKYIIRAVLICCVASANSNEGSSPFSACDPLDYHGFNQDDCCTHILDLNSGERDTTTIVVVGSTGTGKSTQANAIFGKEVFETSSTLKSCTKQTIAKIYSIKICDDRKYQNKNLLKIVDTPGLQDSENRDTEHVKEMVDSIKALKYVNQFQIFFNSQDIRFGNNQNQALQMIEDNFSKDFWLNTVIIFTRWSNQQYAIDMRERQGLYKETVEKEIKEILYNRFPASKRAKLPVFFTDVFEIDQDFEKTTLELSKLIYHAKVSPFFDTTNFEISSFFGWRDEKDYIMKEITQHRQIIKSNFTNYFTAGETIFDERVFKQVLINIENDNLAKKLNKNDYESLKLLVQQIATQVKSEAAENEKNFKDNCIKAGLVITITGIAIKLLGGGSAESGAQNNKRESTKVWSENESQKTRVTNGIN